jgi:hypothetical protein
MGQLQWLEWAAKQAEKSNVIRLEVLKGPGIFSTAVVLIIGHLVNDEGKYVGVVRSPWTLDATFGAGGLQYQVFHHDNGAFLNLNGAVGKLPDAWLEEEKTLCFLNSWHSQKIPPHNYFASRHLACLHGMVLQAQATEEDKLKQDFLGVVARRLNGLLNEAARMYMPLFEGM